MKRAKKVCKKCGLFVEAEKCPLCGGSQFTETWKGRIILLDPEHSELAKRLKLKEKGIYALKI